MKHVRKQWVKDAPQFTVYIMVSICILHVQTTIIVVRPMQDATTLQLYDHFNNNNNNNFIV